MPQHGQGRVQRRPIAGHGAVDETSLAGHALGVEPGAGAGQIAGRPIQQGAGDRGGGRGIRNAHLAADEQIGTGFPGPVHGFPALVQGLFALAFGHGRFVGEVAGAGSDAPVEHARQRTRRMGRAHVHHLEGGTQLPGQHRNGGATPGEVAHHLGGDRLGKGRDPFASHAVIPGEDHDPDRLQHRLLAPLQGRHVHGQGLQPPQGTGRFGELALAFPSRLPGPFVEQRQGRSIPRVMHVGFSRSGFEWQFEAGYYQRDPVAHLRQVLVQPAGRIHETAVQFPQRHHPLPHFVADQQDAPW